MSGGDRKAFGVNRLVTQHGGAKPGEKPFEPLGIHWVQYLLRMNESHDNHGNIRTIFFHSTPYSK